MSRLELDEVRRIARLARLELTDDEVARLAEGMAAVLGRFREVEAAASVATESPGRPEAEERGDRALAPGERPNGGGPSDPRTLAESDGPGADPLLAGPERFAPDWLDGHFLAPLPAAWQDDRAGAPSDRDEALPSDRTTDPPSDQDA